MNNIKYLRIITNESCNLKCFFCHKEGIQNGGSTISFDDLTRMIDILVASGIKKIKLMGGEPTLYVRIEDLIIYIKRKYPCIDLSLISNGIATQNKYASIINSGIDRINISLHGFEPQLFRSITKCNPDLIKQTIENILYIKNLGKLGKVNYVILKNNNEEEFIKVLNFIHDNDLILDVLNFLGEKEEDIYKYFYSFEEIIQIINSSQTIIDEKDYINKNSLPSKRLSLLGGGTINLKVNQLSDQEYMKSCKSCTKKDYCKEGISAIRLTTKGILKPCLLRDDNVFDLLSILGNSNEECISLIKTYFEEL